MTDTTGDLIRRLAAIPYTGAISDILDENGMPNQVLPSQIAALDTAYTLVGRAVTVLGEQTESTDPDIVFRPLLRMLGDLGQGDVIVSSANDDMGAHLGELSASTAQRLGAQGAVIDGGVRDTDYIHKLGFPVFARYRTPRDIAGRWRLRDYNVPIQIGSTPVAPGDLVVGDVDGVVVIPQAKAAVVVDLAERVVDTEDLVRKDIMAGVHPLDAFDRHGRF